MDFAKMSVGLSTHGYEQYCDRVELIAYDDLRSKSQEWIQQRQFHHYDQFIQIDGVLWGYRLDGEEIVLVTCYGRSHFDIPRVIRWSQRHRDLIDLKSSDFWSGWT